VKWCGEVSNKFHMARPLAPMSIFGMLSSGPSSIAYTRRPKGVSMRRHARKMQPMKSLVKANLQEVSSLTIIVEDPFR